QNAKNPLDYLSSLKQRNIALISLTIPTNPLLLYANPLHDPQHAHHPLVYDLILTPQNNNNLKPLNSNRLINK
ncbi:hypothetical protein AAHH78_33040, partial [Burkholderia pseudomallei]